MKKKDYFIFILGIIVITLIFYKFREFEYALVLAILGILVFIALVFFFLMIKEEMKLKKYGVGAIYIFSCCFINDDVNFFKLFKIISRKISNDSFKMSAIGFINYLKEKELLIKLTGNEELEKISEKINFLLEKNDVDLEIESSDIKKLDNIFTDIRRKDKFPTFIHDLNIITKMIREKGYELVQIYPASMFKKKESFYFVIVSMDRLLDLGEVGFLG